MSFASRAYLKQAPYRNGAMTMAEMDRIDSVGKADRRNKRLADAGLRPDTADEAYAIRILADGTWTYHGSPIGRPALVKLFASVLRRDSAGDYWLVTPAEKGRIAVDDAPFVAVEMLAAGTGSDAVLTVRTNLDELVEAGPDHPIRVSFDPDSGEPRPYIRVRDDMEALITRPVYYALADRAVEHSGILGVWSNGCFFALEQS